jgi:antitoxin VapB
LEKSTISTMQQDDPRVTSDAAIKQKRLRDWLQAAGWDGVIISRRDQFAWLTSGGDNRVLSNSEVGFGHLVLTRDRQYLVAHTMDAARILEEQVAGQGYELIVLHWFDGDPRLRAIELAGTRVGADTLFPGAEEVNQSLNYLHYPLTDLEIERSRWLGKAVSEILEKIALSAQPGQTEQEIAVRLHCELICLGIDPDVLIVGSDARIFKYRHPLPTHKPVQKYVLLHPAARRWGLHANVSRSLHFGEPPELLHKAYTAAATIEARILAELHPDLPFSTILFRQKEWYAEAGFPQEWQNHFQGGPTGYVVVDTGRNQTETHVQENQAFDWFVTITGAKVEELSLLTAKGVEILSQTSRWPRIGIQTQRGRIEVPGLWTI